MEIYIQDPKSIYPSAPTLELMNQVQIGKEEIDKERPFEKKSEQRILKELLPSRVVESLNTEGIMITKRQTLDVMHALQAHEGINKGEIEIKNMLEADEFVVEAVDNQEQLTPLFVRELGGKITDGLVAEKKDYRKGVVRISGAALRLPSPDDVPSLVEEMCRCYAENRDVSPLVLSAWLHATLARIHPFSDGNGRTARLLQNWCLIGHGYLPIGMPVSKRDDYYDALESTDHDSWDDLIELICLLELDVVSKVKTILQDEKQHSEWIEQLSTRASESRKSTLYKAYVSWRTHFDDLSKTFKNTCEDINGTDSLLHVRFRGYDITSFDDWKTIRDAGWMERSWLFSLLFSVDHGPFYRTIAFFRRHKALACDYRDFGDVVSLYFTGTEHQSDGTEEKPNYYQYDDNCIALREILIYDGKYYVYTANELNNGEIQCDEYDTINPAIERLFTDAFIKKAGL